MQPSSQLCRTQEARHHALAKGSPLVNVKGVAMLAAAAWAKEALAADKREERLRVRKLFAAQASGLPAEPLSAEDCAFSENPDRGHAASRSEHG